MLDNLFSKQTRSEEWTGYWMKKLDIDKHTLKQAAERWTVIIQHNHGWTKMFGHFERLDGP